MNRYSGILFFVVLFLLTLSCGRPEGTIISGRITELDRPYILATHLSADSLLVDTVEVDRKGRFSYLSNPDTMTAYTLYLDKYESSITVFAGNNERISVQGDARLPDLIKVKGNAVNDALTHFKTKNEDLLRQRALALDNLRMTHAFENAETQAHAKQEEILKLNVLNHELALKAEEEIKEKPAQMSSLILINSFFVQSENPVALRRVLGYLQGDVLESDMAIKLKSYSDKINRSAEDASMPFFSLKDENGEEVRSSDFDGKYLLMNFVSTTGDDSRETIRMLKDEYAELDKEKVEFVTIYIDTDVYPIETVEKDSLPWIAVPEERGWGQI